VVDAEQVNVFKTISKEKKVAREGIKEPEILTEKKEGHRRL